MHVGESLQNCIANSAAPSESVCTQSVLPCHGSKLLHLVRTQAHLGITTMPSPARMTHLTLNIRRKLAIHTSLRSQNLVKLHAWTAGRRCIFTKLKFAPKEGDPVSTTGRC